MPRSFTHPDPDKEPWDQLPDEPIHAYKAFIAYRDMGPDRTIQGAWRESVGNSEGVGFNGSWNTYSTTYHWVPRSEEWDRRLIDVASKSKLAFAGYDAVMWRGRMVEAAQRDWDTAKSLHEKASIALALWQPIRRRTKADDGTTTIIEPSDPASLKCIASTFKEASDLARTAILTALPVEALRDPFDPETATDEEIEDYIRVRSRRITG